MHSTKHTPEYTHNILEEESDTDTGLLATTFLQWLEHTSNRDDEQKTQLSCQNVSIDIVVQTGAGAVSV